MPSLHPTPPRWASGSTLARASRGTSALLTVVVVLALPVFFVTTSVRAAVNSLTLYTFGFQRYGVAEATGIAPKDLEGVARAFIAYFNGPEEWLQIHAPVFGIDRPLLNWREQYHMRDVRGLVRGVYRAQEVSGGVLGVGLVGAFVLRGPRFVGRALLLGGVLSLGLLGVSGGALAVAFSPLFTLFHLLAFRNPFWQLDPSHDMLIQLFPEGFWFLATLLVAAASAVQAGGAALGGWALTRVGQGKRGGDKGPAPPSGPSPRPGLL
jgi:integral membrane protein (TIGR01906 family)